MVVEEEGELDAIISKEDLDKEKARLAELESIKKRTDQITKEKGIKPTRQQRDENKELREELKKLKKRVKESEDKIKEEAKKSRERAKKVEDTFTKGAQVLENPIGFAQGSAIDMLQGLGAKAGIAGAIIVAATMVFKMVQAQFGDGGIWDLRKLVKDVVKSVVALEHVIEVEAGVMIMSADTTLSNLPPGITNTANLRDGHVRFNESTLGYL